MKATKTAKPRKSAIVEPPPTLAVPETPLSSDPERTAIRVEGMTYLVPRSRPCPPPAVEPTTPDE